MVKKKKKKSKIVKLKPFFIEKSDKELKAMAKKISESFEKRGGLL